MKKRSANDAWASLLPDLLLDIFRRLESTALVRCAGACKPWRRAIISNASSLRPRQDRYNPNLLVGFFQYRWDDGEPPPPAIVSVTAVDTGHCQSLSSLVPAAFAGGVDLSSSPSILCSSDGFVLLIFCRGPENYELCLCNPMARECTFFPRPSIKEACQYTLVSGYDHGSVRILAKAGMIGSCTEEEDRLTYQVFSCGSDGTGIWGPVQRSNSKDQVESLRHNMYGPSAVVARDAVYWLAGPKSNPYVITCTVGLDICTGRAWATQLPRQYDFLNIMYSTPYVLTRSGNGGLSLLQPVPDHNRQIQVWVLDGDGDAMEWIVQRKISIHVPNHPADDYPGQLFLNFVCPKSGFLFNVLMTGRQQLINLDSPSSQPVQHIGKRDEYQTDYYPYEMDWSTYISKMKNF